MSILTSKYTSPNVYSYYSRNDNHFYLEIFMFNSIEITFESNIDDYDPYEIGFPGSIENVKIQIIK